MKKMIKNNTFLQWVTLSYPSSITSLNMNNVNQLTYNNVVLMITLKYLSCFIIHWRVIFFPLYMVRVGIFTSIHIFSMRVKLVSLGLKSLIDLIKTSQLSCIYLFIWIWSPNISLGELRNLKWTRSVLNTMKNILFLTFKIINFIINKKTLEEFYLSRI